MQYGSTLLQRCRESTVLKQSIMPYWSPVLSMYRGFPPGKNKNFFLEMNELFISKRKCHYIDFYIKYSYIILHALTRWEYCNRNISNRRYLTSLLVGSKWFDLRLVSLRYQNLYLTTTLHWIHSQNNYVCLSSQFIN